MDLLDLIKSRRSVKAFRPDPVPRNVIERVLDAAVWAPNHRLTEPWTFYVLGPDTKQRFADLRGKLRAEKMPDPAAPEAKAVAQRAYEATVVTPLLVAVSCLVAEERVQRDEDYAATAMAVQNLLLAAASLGVSTYLRTGEIIEHPEAKALLGVPADHRIFGIVYMGFSQEATPTRRSRTSYSEKTRWLD